MNATQKARLIVLQNTLSTAAGVPVEVTIRGLKSFTWSFEGVNHDAARKLKAIAEKSGSRCEVEVLFDLDMTAVYVEAESL